MSSCSRSCFALVLTPKEEAEIWVLLALRARVLLLTALWLLLTRIQCQLTAFPVLGVPKPQITCYTRRWQSFCQCTEKRTPNTNHSCSLPWSRLAAWFCVSGLTD